MAAKVNELLPLEKVEADFRTVKDGGWDEWEVLELRVSESLGEPYSGTVDIASRNRSVNFSLLLGKSCALEIRRGARRRCFKGMIFRVEHLGTNPVASVARVGFAAALWALHHGQDSRIFEDRTAPQVIEEVLKEGLEPFGRKVTIRVGKEYAKREYCVQYRESDLDFVQRLMVDEGLVFYFEQGTDGEKETVVLVDSNYAFPLLDTMGTKEVEEIEPKKRSLMDYATIGQSYTDAYKAGKALTEPEPVNLLVGLPIDPKDPPHREDRFVLKDATGFSWERTAKDNQAADNGRLELLFEGLRRDNQYTLEAHPAGGRQPYRVFENVTCKDVQKAGA